MAKIVWIVNKLILFINYLPSFPTYEQHYWLTRYSLVWGYTSEKGSIKAKSSGFLPKSSKVWMLEWNPRSEEPEVCKTYAEIWPMDPFWGQTCQWFCPFVWLRDVFCTKAIPRERKRSLSSRYGDRRLSQSTCDGLYGLDSIRRYRFEETSSERRPESVGAGVLLWMPGDTTAYELRTNLTKSNMVVLVTW